MKQNGRQYSPSRSVISPFQPSPSGYEHEFPAKNQLPVPSSRVGMPAGQDGLHTGSGVNVSMRDLFAVQPEFIRFVDLDILVPKLVAQDMLTDGEAYSIKNPFIVPQQRVFQLFQCISNKGPRAPANLLQCLAGPPFHEGHMYLASRLLGETRKGI